MPFAALLPDSPITSLIPRRSLTLLCGPPFAAKEKLLRTAVRDYLRDGSWLGSDAPTDPDGVPRTASLGYIGAHDPGFPSTVSHVLWRDWRDYRTDGLPVTIPWLYERFPEPRPRLVIVDNIQSFQLDGKVNDYCSVMRWGRDLSHWQHEHDVTLIGLAPATKTREEDGGYAPHNRILGSVAWAQLAYTLWLLDLVDRRVTEEAMTASMRLLITLTHGPRAPRWTYYDLDSEGWLVPTLDKPAPDDAIWRSGLETAAAASPGPFRTSEAIAWGQTLSISKATVDRWLFEMCDAGKLGKIRKGVWRWEGTAPETH